MGAPTRFLSGITQARVEQPLGQVGVPDPFFYAYYEDDFLPYNAALYTVTASGGSVAQAAGAGGRVTFNTAATAASYPTLSLPAAVFQYVAGLKMAYLCRLRIDNITNDTFIAGLINTTTTPFAAISDGIYFLKAAGTTNIVVNVVTGGTVVGTTTIVGALTVSTDIDLGFLVDRLGNIKIYYGASLEGYRRQNNLQLGPDASIPASSLTGAITSALLNPTISIGNGATAAPITGSVDFQFAGTER